MSVNVYVFATKNIRYPFMKKKYNLIPFLIIFYYDSVDCSVYNVLSIKYMYAGMSITKKLRCHRAQQKEATQWTQSGRLYFYAHFHRHHRQHRVIIILH